MRTEQWKKIASRGGDGEETNGERERKEEEVKKREELQSVKQGVRRKEKEVGNEEMKLYERET